ncbi:MAG TPA: ATP-binding protein [Pirellulales bacterium]|jgi:signal transduction histidine kinase/CheY-like chemotaxis protein|nr:ATP-binding protein [Pirellulales bacterium]
MSSAQPKATLKILKGSNAGDCYNLSADRVVLGREPQCDIVLPRTTISRRHAQIARDAEGFFIEDLDSLNGTFVDSSRIAGPQRLRGGEHIQIDEFLMSFRQANAQADEVELDLRTQVLVTTKGLADPTQNDRKQNIRSTFVGDFAVLSGAGLRSEVDPQVKLDAVLDIIRNVGTPLDIDEVLQRILDTLFQIFPQADRGYMFLTEAGELQTLPCAMKHRVYEEDPASTIGLRNSSLAAEVITAGEPLLFTFADDSRSGRGESPLADPIRATMAAPMLTPSNETVGVLQLETEDTGRQFIDKDLHLLASIGSLAGQLVEHTRLIERDRAEAALAREHAALSEANRRKDEFLAMLGHELRNPLAPLVSALAVMAEKNMDAETLDWARQLMERQVGHMVRLVDDLLDVSRIERGKFTLRIERVELARVIANAVEASQPLINSHGHTLHLSVSSEPHWLEADPTRLAQVLTNLLNNAAKYMEPGGKIWLTAETGGGQLIIRVRDTGIGIAAEMLPRVFEPFTQAKQSLDRSQGGLGIGLSLVRKIVELHGGDVSAESEGPRRGSTFTIRLPIVETSENESRESPAAIEGAVPRRVLVVDDQVAQAEVLAKLFTKLWGHDVAIAHDGTSAWESMRAQHPDVVLLDIGLPGVNGYELARRVRGEPEFRDTLLVALTGYGQEADQLRSQEAGFDLHLVKPPSVSILKEVFAHPKLGRQS